MQTRLERTNVERLGCRVSGASAIARVAQFKPIETAFGGPNLQQLR